MPQMAPLNWLTLYIIFLMIFLFFIILNYYSYMNNTMKINLTFKKKLINWKW